MRRTVVVHLPIKRFSTLDCDIPNKASVLSPITPFRAITSGFAGFMRQALIYIHRMVRFLI
jgi:hypothetical protein